jgi:hypothetical protein
VRRAGSDGRCECSSWWIWEIVFASKLAIARLLFGRPLSLARAGAQ